MTDKELIEEFQNQNPRVTPEKAEEFVNQMLRRIGR